MANSTSNIDPIINGQGAQHLTANAFFDAASTATTYGRRMSTTSGLTWGFYGGNASLSTGSMSQIANGTILLTASTTNYIVAAKSTGVVSTATTTTNWNDLSSYWRIYSVVTGVTTITSYTDYREFGRISGSDLSTSIPIITDATTARTLVLTDLNSWIRFTNTAAKTLTVPTNASVAFPIGTIIRGNQEGAGQITFTPTGGVTINKPASYNAKTKEVGSTFTLIKIATDIWELFGDLEDIPEAVSIITDSTTARTLALTDLNSWIRFTNTAPKTLTIPLNSSVAFPVGVSIGGIQAAAGVLTITPAGGVTINKPASYNAKTRETGSTWGLTKVATDEWDLYGDLELTV